MAKRFPAVSRLRCGVQLLPKHGLDALLHFRRRHVFFVRGHPPEMTKRVFKLAGPVAVKLVSDRLAFRCSGGHRLLEESVHVLHVEMDIDGRAAQRLRRP